MRLIGKINSYKNLTTTMCHYVTRPSEVCVSEALDKLCNLFRRHDEAELTSVR